MKIDVKNSKAIQDLSALLSLLEKDLDVLLDIKSQIDDLKKKYNQKEHDTIDKIHLINNKFNLSDEDILELYEINIDQSENNKKKYYDEYGRVLKDLQKSLDIQ